MTPSDVPTLTCFTNAWLAELPRRYRPSTVVGYGCVLRLHVLPRLGDRPIDTVTRRDVRALLDDLEDRYARSTVRMIHGALAGVFRAARKARHVRQLPTRGVLCGRWGRNPKRPPRALWPAELAQLLVSLRALAAHFLGLVQLLSRTGLRIGEALALQPVHVNLVARWVYIDETYHGAGRTGDPKTERSLRYVDLSTDAVVTLTELLTALPAGARWLFEHAETGLPYHARTVQEAIRTAADEAGLGRVTPHVFRHTFASWMIAAGATPADVQRQLGHASIQTTIDLYGKWFRMRNPDMADLVDRVARGDFDDRLHAAPGPHRSGDRRGPPKRGRPDRPRRAPKG